MKKNDLILIGGFAVLMAVINVVLVRIGSLSWTGGWDWTTFGTMAGAAVTIAIMSQLYKDNPLFRLAEHMFVGSALGYGLVLVWYNMWVTDIFASLSPIATYGWDALLHPVAVAKKAGKPHLLGVWSIIIPAVLGMMMYTRLTKKYAWISRWPYAIMIGFGVGMAIPNEITANLLMQLKPMMVDLFHNADGQFLVHRADMGGLVIEWGKLSEIVIFVGVLSTLFYFFFSIEHKGAAKVISRTGVLFLMVAFGASFGYTVMGRLSLLIGRIDFLFKNWIPLIP